MLKKIILLSIILLSHWYLYESSYVEKVDNKIYDVMMGLTHRIKPHDEGFYTVIVDIDEKSIQSLGQWPWSRVILANLIDKIEALSPSAMGVDILFPEVDRVSPLNIQHFYKNFFSLEVNFTNIPLGLRDNDKLFLESVVNANATLSTYFYDDGQTLNHCQKTQYKNNIFANQESSISANSFLCNHQKLQEAVPNFGFLNAWQDSDGIFRRIPLFVHYEQNVFPSFSLATILSFDENFKVEGSNEPMLLNFFKEKPNVFSAIDILNGNIPKEFIQGKIVILGSSLVGVTPKFKISTGEQISNAMIHALSIENLLNNEFLKQPKQYKEINILLSTLFILFSLYLFTRKEYLAIITLVTSIGTLSFFGTLFWYQKGVYLSIAYLWLPFLLLFVGLIINHVREMNQEKIAQEKLFIRQSKLASMGEMIALIAHQWRQPLSSINGIVLNIDMDNHKKILDEQRLTTYLDDIEQTTAYLSKTINDFTDFFAQDKRAYPFNLGKVIDQAKDLALKGSSRRTKIVVLNQEDIEIKGYASELVQSLLVLLNNAIYVCEKRFETGEEGKIFIHVFKEKKEVLIAVEDNGGGVPRNEMKKIFNPYYTTKEAHHGTGLGLYILKLIVEDSMNGKISLHNTQKGAVFTIRIPQNIE